MFLAEITSLVLEYTTTGKFLFGNSTYPTRMIHEALNTHLQIPFSIQHLLRLERHDMFDMVPILHDSTILIVRPTPLDMDLGLLIRPYRKDAWVFVAVVVVAIFGLLLIPFLFISEYSKYTR